MKILTISFLSLCMATQALGQMTDHVDNHFILEPKQKKDSINIETSCLILMRDYPMIISTPLNRSYEMIIPKGTKYLVEKGVYQLENSADAILEFELVPADKCRN